MTQEEKRAALHQFVDNVFDNSQVTDWVGLVRFEKTANDNGGVLTWMTEMSAEAVLDLAFTMVSLVPRELPKDLKPGVLLTFDSHETTEWSKL